MCVIGTSLSIWYIYHAMLRWYKSSCVFFRLYWPGFVNNIWGHTSMIQEHLCVCLSVLFWISDILIRIIYEQFSLCFLPVFTYLGLQYIVKSMFWWYRSNCVCACLCVCTKLGLWSIDQGISWWYRGSSFVCLSGFFFLAIWYFDDTWAFLSVFCLSVLTLVYDLLIRTRFNDTDRSGSVSVFLYIPESLIYCS